uniref:Uncharacterized protein n=1 Tax=Avena sativa TaxID=4498 RepID=A0ACD5VS00_AVESA
MKGQLPRPGDHNSAQPGALEVWRFGLSRYQTSICGLRPVSDQKRRGMAAEGSELVSPATAQPPAPKRRKIEPSRRTRPPPSQGAPDKDKVVASSNSSVSGTPLARVDLNEVREAKRFAVLQAQHEGCLGSFKSFDSLFGNYLVPVTPSDDFFEQIVKN